MNESTTGTVTIVARECGYCGCTHIGGGVCPRVEEIEYHRDGTVKRVKLREECDRPHYPPAPIYPHPTYPVYPGYPMWTPWITYTTGTGPTCNTQ